MQPLIKFLVTVDGLQYGWRYPNVWEAIAAARELFPGARGVFAKEISGTAGMTDKEIARKSRNTTSTSEIGAGSGD